MVCTRALDGSRTIISANVGDSDAMLLSPGLPQQWFSLTEDHGPDSVSEYQRVQAIPADICPHKLLFVYDKTNVYKKFLCPLVFKPDASGTRDPIFVQDPWGQGLHPTNVRYDAAVYAVTSAEVSRDTTCIAMTRSVGT